MSSEESAIFTLGFFDFRTFCVISFATMPLWTIPKPSTDSDKPKPSTDTDKPIEVGLLGDVNGDGDGDIDSADTLLILRASVGLDDLSDEKKFVGDVNGDGTVDSADALDVLRYSVGLSANDNIGKPVTKKAA